MWSWFTNGNTDTNDGDSIAEGIGQGRVTKNIEGITVDKAYRLDDQTALTIVYQLLREEGLFLGFFSGINVAGAVRFAKERSRRRHSSRFSTTQGTSTIRRFITANGLLKSTSTLAFR